MPNTSRSEKRTKNVSKNIAKKAKSNRKADAHVKVSAQDLADMRGQLDGINASQAVIAFTPDGNVMSANNLFLGAVGYRLEEIVNRHHSQFVGADYKVSAEYREFWEALRRGEAQVGEFKRFGKGGKEIWIQASYTPIKDSDGRVFKIVKYATDVTARRLAEADYRGQIDGINASQAVISFTPDGNVMNANQLFLAAIGYRLDEIEGRHHNQFVTAELKASNEYREFWEALRRGQAQTGEFKRVGKGGREIWIQASYTPIRDLNGRVFKVVKYASDITLQKQTNLEVERLVRAAGSTIQALAAGDLTAHMDGEFRGELGVLQQQLNSTISTLASLVSQISQAAQSISQGASDISEGNANLNTRTQQQSSALEETAASLEEMTATVKQNANNATEANQLASGAKDAAEKGGQVVGSAVNAMGAITDASKKVADIISVIEQIAFQTNMLALNAAVEAARAGDQGRGFAVVAAEVRTLAQRSASAAKEIKALIQDSQEKVEQGAKLVNRSGETLLEIVTSVKKVSDIIGEINAASDQQATGIDQVNSAVAQMDKNTQQNAAMVEEASAAAEAMTDQARAMNELVAFFRVNESSAEGTPELRVVGGRKPANQNGSAPRRRAQPEKIAVNAPSRRSTSDDDEWKEF